MKDYLNILTATESNEIEKRLGELTSPQFITPENPDICEDFRYEEILDNISKNTTSIYDIVESNISNFTYALNHEKGISDNFKLKCLYKKIKENIDFLDSEEFQKRIFDFDDLDYYVEPIVDNMMISYTGPDYLSDEERAKMNDEEFDKFYDEDYKSQREYLIEIVKDEMKFELEKFMKEIMKYFEYFISLKPLFNR